MTFGTTLVYLYACAHFGIFWCPVLALGANHNTTSVSYCCSVGTTYLQARIKIMGEWINLKVIHIAMTNKL